MSLDPRLMTDRGHRRLRWSLVPLRLAVTAVGLACVAAQVRLLQTPSEPTGSASGDAALDTFFTLFAVLFGVGGAVLAILAWSPLPKPDPWKRKRAESDGAVTRRPRVEEHRR